MAKAKTDAVKNGTAVVVADKTTEAEMLGMVADIFEKHQVDSGKTGYSKLIVIRNESGKVFLGKIFSGHIGLFTESMKLPLQTKVTRGKIVKSK